MDQLKDEVITDQSNERSVLLDRHDVLNAVLTFAVLLAMAAAYFFFG